MFLIRRKFRTLLTPILLGALLSACSQVKLAYNRVDTLAGWYVGSYVSLNDEQDEKMDAALEDLLQWHCGEELPRYADALDAIANDAERGAVNAAMIDYWSTEVDTAWDRLAERVLPATVEILMSLDPQQVDELEQNLAEKLAENREEFASSDYSSERRAKRIEKNLRRWLGKLEPAQRERVVRWEQASRPLLPSWNDSRENWNRLFIDTLRSTSEEREKQLYALLSSPEQFRSDEHLAEGAEWRAGFSAMLEDIYAMSTPKQRDRSASELRAWRDDFSELACQAPQNGAGQVAVSGH